MASISCRRLLRPVWCNQLLTVQPQARQTWKQHAMCMHTAVARRWTVYTSPHARTVGLLQQRHPVHLMHRRHVLTAAVQRRLDTSIQRHEEITAAMSSQDTPVSEMQGLAEEAGRLSATVEKALAYRDLVNEANDLKALVEAADGDNSSEEEREMAAMAAEELSEIQERIAEAEQNLKLALLPRDELDDRSAVLEVRAGTGGVEAMLFTYELLEMYRKAAAAQGWRFQVIEMSQGERTETVAKASVSVSGHGAFGVLKHESGTHRVQRVPATESTGRIHTSAMTVVVMPEAGEVDVDITPADLRIDTFRAQGAGGQHVNTTDSAIRITHIPTGIVVACQDERSQHKNKDKAMKLIRARVFEAERARRAEEKANARRELLASGDRSERVRTYNFVQDRVTDHRVGVSKFGITAMLNGEFLPEFTAALKAAEDEALLATLGDSDDDADA